jgi:hypothetical protein
MEFFKLEGGWIAQIGRFEAKENATFFKAESKEILAQKISFPDGKPTGGTNLKKIARGAKIRVKVCFGAVFEGVPLDIIYFGNQWQKSNDYYLRTQIIPGKLYCYSWIDRDGKGGGKCVSFEIVKEK